MTDLWIVFPFLAYAGILAWELSVRDSCVEAMLRAAIWWAAGVWVLSNGLSMCSALQPVPLRATWAVLGVGSLLTGISRFKETRASRRLSWPSFHGWEWCLIAAAAGLVGLVFITAIFSPPVTVDVLNYHLPRQLMWLQQGSLAHYFTVNDRELMMPPLAEVIGMQFLALSGGDRWVNLPQWLAYALLPLVIGKIARGLGMSRGAALLAAWLGLCLPMAYHEGSNAKNDLQGAFWIALLCWRVVEARNRSVVKALDAGLVGLILALALLTKSTAFIYTPPLIVAGWMAWTREGGWRPAARRGILAAGVCLVMVTPFFARNVAWYGTPLGIHRAEDGGQQANEAVTPAIVLSNGIRNTAVQLAMPSREWNEKLKRGVEALHRRLGISVQDPRNTLWVLGFDIAYLPGDETRTTAPVQFVAMLLGLGWALGSARARAWRWLAWSIISMGLLFCAVLKWQPWGARLELPMFILGTVVIAGAADAMGMRKRYFTLLLLGGLGAVSWWPGREDDVRPLWTEPSIFALSREVNRYRYQPHLRQRDEAFVDLIKAAGVQNVAIVSIHDIPYSLMRKLRERIPEIRFDGAPVRDQPKPAEAYVSLGLLKPLPLYYPVTKTATYRLVGSGAGDGIYLPPAKVAALGWEHQLPDYGGWSRSENFQLGVDMPSLAGPALTVRYLPKGRGMIEFAAEGQARYLTAELLRITDELDDLVFECNGIAVTPDKFLAQSGKLQLEFTLETHPGMNRFVIKHAGQGNQEVSFTRLVINDVPPLNPPPDLARPRPVRSDSGGR
jgi:hypothetical protein